VIPHARGDERQAELQKAEPIRVGITGADAAFATTGTRVLWVGHVRTNDPKVGATNRHINQLAVAAAKDRPFVEVADLAELLGTGESTASRCLVSDGLHLSVACLDEAAGKLRDRLPPLH